MGVLESKGYCFKSGEGTINIYKGDRVIMRGFRDQSLYYLDATTVLGESESNTQDESELWHRRLGHVSENGLNELLKQGVLKDPTCFKLQKCEHCVLGKSKKQPYGTTKFISNAPLDYAHYNL